MTDQNSPLVLVVDDDRTIRSLLRVAMEEEGYRVADANNGEHGLAEFIRLEPDLVLLDAVMPVLDGFACCRQLRELPLGQDVPVLMITVLDDPESVDRAFDCGATDYVTKPLHWAVLAQRVRRLLTARTALAQLRQLEDLFAQQQQRERWWRSWFDRLAASGDEAAISQCLAEMKAFLEMDGAGADEL
ncbi:two-component system response regulator [[Phormidium] sp. ETS-05]|uniref:response regulator n=1 Tax=[Phormidium] sp. ETS-05 TaxID=222819 RepID=UPI0018EF0BE6|nr:response regulator [[Phormidium] sp. ETS-05]